MIYYTFKIITFVRLKLLHMHMRLFYNNEVNQ